MSAASSGRSLHLIISQLRTKYSSSNCLNHVRRTKSSIKKRIIVCRTVRSMFGEQTLKLRTGFTLDPRTKLWMTAVSVCVRARARACVCVCVCAFACVSVSVSVKPVLNWANVCSPNILRTVRLTMIRFLIELLVRRTWFRQFDELYFVLNWLVMRCKLRPELASMIENVD